MGRDLEIIIRRGGFTIAAENEHGVAQVTMTVSLHAKSWMIAELATEAINELNRSNGADFEPPRDFGVAAGDDRP